jgi:hypothetical protein
LHRGRARGVHGLGFRLREHAGSLGREAPQIQLDISKSEQKKRLEARRSDPLKQWKVSPIDDQAIKQWKACSRARNEMLARTHTPTTPWTLVRTDDKHLARLNIIKDLLDRVHYTGKDKRLIEPDPEIVFAFDASNLESDQLAK